MIYDVTLKMYYEYGSATDLGRQIVRVLPRRETPAQRLIARHLDIHPDPTERRYSVDFFGNEIVELGFDAYSADLEVIMRARVERRSRAGGLDLSPDRATLARSLEQETRLDARSPLHFMGDSPRIHRNSNFRRYAEKHSSACATVLECVEAIGLALHVDMEFVPGVTEVDTRPEDAFEDRRGVCQDFSHVMIGCLRSIGIPAGYVSGFLRTLPPEGQKRLEGADAMHAWVRTWCGHDLGWVDFDPTNAMRAGPDHVDVAVGRDYADVSPLRGVTRTAGSSLASHSVDVVAAGTLR